MSQLDRVLQVNDTESLNLTLSGAGTPQDPLILSGSATPRLLDLADVQDALGPENGDVPFWTGGGTGHWEFGAPSTTPPGAVGVGDGLTGDGSVGNEIEVATSGVWGVGDLADLGADSTIGLEVYVDSAGELRARPVTGGTASSIAWEDVSGKPTTFAPQIGLTSTTAKAGNWKPTWTDVQSKPTAFSPSAHDHAAGDIVSGVLPLNRGGTGGSTRGSARVSLGFQSGVGAPATSLDADIYFEH